MIELLLVLGSNLLHFSNFTDNLNHFHTPVMIGSLYHVDSPLVALDTHASLPLDIPE